MTEPTSAALPRALSPSLFLFTIVYGGMVVLAGVPGNKQVALGSWLAVEAGILAFLLPVPLSSAVSALPGPSVAHHTRTAHCRERPGQHVSLPVGPLSFKKHSPTHPPPPPQPSPHPPTPTNP